MSRPWRAVTVVVVAAVFVVGGLVGDHLLALSNQARSALRLYTELLNVTRQHADEPPSYRDLIHSSIDGMLRTLDPHSAFLPPEQYSEMRERQQESFSGLGILISLRHGELTVVTPLEGTPASRLGIRAGDVISMIEGESTERMSLDEAVQRLKGPKGTSVQITIVRAGLDEPLQLEVVRDEIPQNTVRYAYMLDESTGYIALTDFSRSSTREMVTAIERLRSAGMKRLLLDLRGNGGGLLDQAVSVSELFLPQGLLIVETRGRTRGADVEFHAGEGLIRLDLPLVVLVGESTASAAEILAGAIQDHDYGLVVGLPTWGKGLVQTVYSLSYGSGLALTTAKYYTPSGRLIQRDYTDFYDYAAHVAPGEIPEEPAEPPQTFYTDLNREVYGGGGITPDIEVELEEMPPFMQFLVARDAFFQFATAWVNRHALASPTWTPDQATLDAFRAWVVEEEIASPEEMAKALEDPAVAEPITHYLRAEAVGSQFGLEARSRVLIGTDAQVRTALESFPEAARLLARRRQLDEDASRVATR